MNELTERRVSSSVFFFVFLNLAGLRLSLSCYGDVPRGVIAVKPSGEIFNESFGKCNGGNYANFLFSNLK